MKFRRTWTFFAKVTDLQQYRFIFLVQILSILNKTFSFFQYSNLGALYYILKVSNSFYHIMEFNWKAIIKWGLRRSWRMCSGKNTKTKQYRECKMKMRCAAAPLPFDVETKWKLKRTETIWWMMKYLISFKHQNEITNEGGGDCQ